MKRQTRVILTNAVGIVLAAFLMGYAMSILTPAWMGRLTNYGEIMLALVCAILSLLWAARSAFRIADTAFELEDANGHQSR